jgi:hypothetical protein
MSDEKVAATYHGKCTCHEGLCARHPLIDPVDRLRDVVTCCWMAKHTGGDDHVRMCPNFRETTGEHTKAKLADDPYTGVIAGMEAMKAAAWSTSQFSQHTGSAIPGVPSSEERYAQHAAPRRPWSPTHKELAVCLAIVGVILLVAGIWIF